MARPIDDSFSMNEDAGSSAGEDVSTQTATQTAAQSPKSTKETIQGLVESGYFNQNPNAVLINGTYYQPEFSSTGSGEDYQQGALKNVYVYKESDARTGGTYEQYNPAGELERTGVQQKVASFGGGIAEALRDPMVGLALSTVLPGIGVAVAETLGISTAAGTAIAKVAVSVAQGVPFENAIKDAAISSIVQTGSVDAAKEIVGAGADPKVANAIASVGGSIVQTAAKGGDASDILTNALAAGGASALISMDVSPSVAKAIGVIASGGNVQAALNTLASGIGESKDVRNVVANTFLPSEPPETPAVTPEAQPAVTPIAEAQPTPSDPVPTVEVATPAVPASVDQPIIDLVKKDVAKSAEPTPTPAPPAEEVKVAAPAEKAPDQAILDLITPKAPAAEPTPAPAPAPAPAPVEEVKVTEKKEEQPVIVDTSAPPLITPTPSVAETPSPTAAPTPELEVTAPRPTVSPEDQPILDLITPKETPPATTPEMVVTAPRDEEVKVTAKKEDVPIIDTVPEMTITDSKIPEMTITAPKEPAIIDTIPEIEVTDKRTPEMVITAPKEPTIIDTTTPDLVEPPVEEEPAPEEPYKPQITIFGGVPGKRKGLPQTLQAPFYPSAGLTQALTAQRGAGEIEGDPSGKPRKNVWNEASLRLKDALGL